MRFIRSLNGTALIVCGGLCALAQAASAVELPKPTGPYAVGRTLTHITDDDRPETWTDDPNDRRALPMFVWYPADVKPGTPVAEYSPYPPDKIRGRLAVERGRGRVLTIHTYADAPVAKDGGAFPVLLFSGGAGASPSSYHALIEELVSHGYIVIGLDHVYEGAGQILGDGRLIEPTADNFRPQGDPQTKEYADASRAFYFRRVAERSADAKMAASALKMMNDMPRSKFAGRLDLARIGVFGHSLGGVAAAHALMDVPAIKAGVNLDGHAMSMPFDEAHTPAKPFLCVEAPSERPTDEKLAEWNMTRETYDKMIVDTNQKQTAAYRTNPTVSYRITINGAEHGSFSDETYPMPDKDGTKSPLREKYTAAARHYLLAFFDHHLRGKPVPSLSAAPSEFADFTSVEAFGAQAAK